MLSASQRLQLRRTLPFYTFAHKAHSATFSVYWNVEPTLANSQATVVVPKKVLKLATQRNRLKRVVRALLSSLLSDLPKNVQIVVLARRPELGGQLAQLKQTIETKIK